MKTTVEFKDGSSVTFDDAAPSVYEDNLSFVDADCGVPYDDIPLAEIKRVVFEND